MAEIEAGIGNTRTKQHGFRTVNKFDFPSNRLGRIEQGGGGRTDAALTGSYACIGSP